MKNLRKLFAVTLLILTLGLPTWADGQMETPLAPPTKATPVATEDEGSDAALPQNGQMETPQKSALLSLVESILALI